MPKSTYPAAEKALAQRLSSSALEHCRRTAVAARHLAELYGVDPDAAALAGLLHDWDREVAGRDLVGRAQSQGLELTDVEQVQPKLLHARTGATAVREQFPSLPPEVFSAIEKHTVGAPEMTDLDRVVYLADMLESDRQWPGADELRARVGRISLAELFFEGYGSTITSLIARGKRLHPDTVAVWNSLVVQRKAREKR